ncbi:hypothetical protein SBF1_650001 [Candidatus Desulfosporosinus infrequens]|uniref:Uncharacterized protein n=1 Tax=Candidatus Desulfosporosinus infrequens TaxID=2043169 RepID=A0A2U3LMX7_9FIRM|nr:hypothetical protein SBF1_650001 [Candidatus Desulfosporosinus infrequens]
MDTEYVMYENSGNANGITVVNGLPLSDNLRVVFSPFANGIVVFPSLA